MKKGLTLIKKSNPVIFFTYTFLAIVFICLANVYCSQKRHAFNLKAKKLSFN